MPEEWSSAKAVEIGSAFGFLMASESISRWSTAGGARLRGKISDEEVASVNPSLARSLAQLHVKRRRHR